MSENTQQQNTNPFLGLFEQSAAITTNDSPSFTSNKATTIKTAPSPPIVASLPLKDSSSSSEGASVNILDIKVNSLIEKIFLFTINKEFNQKKQMVYLQEIARFSDNGLFKFDLLEQALFERLLLTAPEDYVIPNDRAINPDSHVAEGKVITYLFRAFESCEESRNDNDCVATDLCSKINALIIRNICTSIRQPELYEGQSLPTQWLDILKDPNNDESLKRKFLVYVVQDLFSQCDEGLAMSDLKGIFYAVLKKIQKLVRDANMINLPKWIIEVIMLLVSEKDAPQLGALFIDFTTPNPNTDGRVYGDTLLGQLLSLSILPKYQRGPYEFYSNPTDSLSSSINSSLWNALTKHLDDMYLIFKKLLTLRDDVKRKTLSWIGNCLDSNIQRGQVWNMHNLSSLYRTASDAFMMGLCGILLRLCRPLFKPTLKVLLVDPTYCAVPETDRSTKNVNLKNVYKETCLLPTEENEERLIANSYNFITECFFMTHKAINLSYKVCIENFMRMGREINKLQSAYEDAMAQGGGEVAQNMMKMLTTLMQEFMCLKHCLIEPNNDQLLLQMCEATAIWLTEVTAKTEDDLKEMNATTGYAPMQRKNVTLPLSDYVPPYLKCIPEYIIQNILSYLTFMRHFENQAIRFDLDAQSEIFRMILIFIGSIERARNPHLRAELADGLESLIPKGNSSTFVGTFRTKLFSIHPDRLQIIPNLLKVFVSIEMTGQSVQFEQKFQYRRPMYAIMEFLWEMEEQKECFKQLALEAEEKIEEINPPIFLRFVNLLINDAIHLLDESLTNLQQIRTLQTAQDNGEWNNLSDNERERQIADLQQLGNLARFDNILGKDTINMLKLLTSEIKGIFCHKSMVDRVAAMLNYFLLSLVGPKKREFNVKVKKEFEFDPAHTVKEICNIYINLKDCDEFCLAVSQDGRSYSSELFEYADQVLSRIGGGQLIGDMNEFALKVQQIEKQHKEDQEALTDTPDEYLDPIMSTLMMDPVILPSSRVTVDRSTIARHLLSDQSDPFNRSPLTMDQVKSNVELKEEIMQWIKQKRKEYSESKQQQNQEADKLKQLEDEKDEKSESGGID